MGGRRIEAVIADSLCMGCGDVEEISLYELGHGQCHGIASLWGPVREGNFLLRRGDDASVGNGAAPDIPGEIDQYALPMVVPLPDVDVPLGTAQFVLEVLPLLHGHRPRQGYHAFLNRVVEQSEKLPAEYSHDGTYGKKIAVMPCFHPSLIIKAAFSDKTMEVGMQDHGLTPGVERCDDARFCTDVFRVAKELVECLPHADKEQRGHVPHIQQPQIVQFMRQREDHVVMTAGKKPFLLPLQPLSDANPIALRADPMTARVVPLPVVMSFWTRFHVTA